MHHRIASYFFLRNINLLTILLSDIGGHHNGLAAAAGSNHHGFWD